MKAEEDWFAWLVQEERTGPGDEAQIPVKDRVSALQWASRLFIDPIVSIALLAAPFHSNVGEAILVPILGPLFSFIGIQSADKIGVNTLHSCWGLSTHFLWYLEID